MTTPGALRGATRPAGERGSVLMLVPAAVVVVLLLGAIAVDSAIVYLEQRRAYNAAADAANDAAGAGLDRDALRRGDTRYDAARVRAVAADSVAAGGDEAIGFVDATVDGNVVNVTVEVTIEHVFVQVFGRDGTETMQMSAEAAGVLGP